MALRGFERKMLGADSRSLTQMRHTNIFNCERMYVLELFFKKVCVVQLEIDIAFVLLPLFL